MSQPVTSRIVWYNDTTPARSSCRVRRCVRNTYSAFWGCMIVFGRVRDAISEGPEVERAVARRAVPGRPEETREQRRELLVVLRLELEGDRCVHGPPDVRQEDEEDDPEDGEDVAHLHGFPEGVPPIPSGEGAVGSTHPGEVRPTEDLVDREARDDRERGRGG